MFLTSSTFHGLQKNIFERVAPEVHAPDAHLALRRQAENVASLHSIRQNHLHAVRGYGTLTTELLDRVCKIAIRALGLEFQESLVGATLLVQV